jgi:hypothetical protein
MNREREGELKGRIALFEQVIAQFKRAREQMLKRRNVATGHVMAELDKQIEANARALEGFERSLAQVKETLIREDSERG